MPGGSKRDRARDVQGGVLRRRLEQWIQLAQRLPWPAATCQDRDPFLRIRLSFAEFF